jgi:hypothetical protein
MLLFDLSAVALQNQPAKDEYLNLFILNVFMILIYFEDFFL